MAGAIAALIALTVLVLGVIGWVGSERAIHRAPTEPEYALADYDFAPQTETVRFPSLDGTPLAGWFVPAAAGGGRAPTVVLVHGFGPSRWELLPHAAYLHRAGYNVLLFDFRGRGESGGGAITLGAREPLDVRGAVDYVFSRPDVDRDRVAVQGVSLGASSGILAMADDPRIAAIVAESPFTTMRGVITQSFEYYIGLPSFPFAPVTTFIIERRLHVDADRVRPIDAITRIGQRPVFLIEDLNDTAMPPQSGRQLYAVASGPKELWLVDNAGHSKAYKVAPAEYERRVLAFYSTYLQGTPRSAAETAGPNAVAPAQPSARPLSSLPDEPGAPSAPRPLAAEVERHMR